MTERLDGRTVLVTGANGGLGEEFVRQAVERGAARVYAAARRPKDWGDERVVPLELDVTSPTSVAAAAATATDVDLLVNNAGIAPSDDHSVIGFDEELAHRIVETNAFGILRTTAAFAPVLAANGGGAVLNVLSAAAWLPLPTVYAVSKAAGWSLTGAQRSELAPQGTTVTGLLVGMIDTAMGARWDVPKSSPADVVTQALDGVARGDHEVLADDDTRWLKPLLGGSSEDLVAAVAPALSGFDAAAV
jgi:NAD(P)-dependent dehydrogenase (short-subunit alcohol dehydrogenase family)